VLFEMYIKSPVSISLLKYLKLRLVTTKLKADCGIQWRVRLDTQGWGWFSTARIPSTSFYPTTKLCPMLPYIIAPSCNCLAQIPDNPYLYLTNVFNFFLISSIFRALIRFAKCINNQQMHLNFMLYCYLSCLHQRDSASNPPIFRRMVKNTI